MFSNARLPANVKMILIINPKSKSSVQKIFKHLHGIYTEIYRRTDKYIQRVPTQLHTPTQHITPPHLYAEGSKYYEFNLDNREWYEVIIVRFSLFWLANISTSDIVNSLCKDRFRLIKLVLDAYFLLAMRYEELSGDVQFPYAQYLNIVISYKYILVVQKRVEVTSWIYST